MKKKATTRNSSARKRLILYLPLFLQAIREYIEIFKAEDIELDTIESEIDLLKDDIFITQASDTILKEYENILNIYTSSSNRDERVSIVLSRLRGSPKLNEATIKDIVNAITGGSAIVKLIDQTIDIKILPPSREYEINFNDIYDAIESKKPVHLSLNVERFFSTWGDIKNDHVDWNAVSKFANWEDVKNYVES
jgi:Uncharacterized protein conserved in bacteria (DUF2313).